MFGLVALEAVLLRNLRAGAVQITIHEQLWENRSKEQEQQMQMQLQLQFWKRKRLVRWVRIQRFTCVQVADHVRNGRR